MANSINIVPNSNDIEVSITENKITVIDATSPNGNVYVTQPTTQVVQVLTGPKGDKGDFPTSGSFNLTGSINVTGSISSNYIQSDFFTGSFYGNGTGIFSGSFSGSVSSDLQDITNNGNVTTLPITASSFYGNGFHIVGDAIITGSLIVSSSNTFKNIGSTQFTGSTSISGSLDINGIDYGFTSASFDQRILNSSSSISTLSSSFIAFSESYNTGSFTGSFIGDGSQLTGIVSSKWSGSNPITRDSNVEITGSLRVTNGITASLYGTASWAEMAETASYSLFTLSSSYVETASLAISASYYQETDPIFVALSGSFATTGSNTFQGTQTITGSNGRLIYTGTTLGLYPTLAEIHANDDYPWLERFYNDTFSTSSAIMAYFGWSDGRFVFHNESTQSIGLQVNGFNAENGLLVYPDKVAFVNNVEVTGSLNVVGGITGSLFGTASFATLAHTASYVLQAVSSSYAATASYVANASSFPFTGSAIITGSLIVTGSVTATQGFTGSLFGTASFATSAFQAITASYVLQAVSASFASNGGVSQLLAGPNITLSPSTGLGQVTISSTGGGGGFNTATGSYGSFYSTQTQTNVAGTARSMSLNITDITNGVSISGSISPFNTYIKTENAGIYNIQFSAQVDKTDSGTDEIWIWLRKNGTNLTDTATSIQLVGNGAHYVAAWNFFVNAAANDYFQLMWYSPDGNVRLHAEPAFGVVPGIPSVIVTANRVDQFLSNTGSFSGTFTGNLFGTASFVTTASYTQNALSASYALTASYLDNYIPPFPFTGSAVITGSLIVTGSVSATSFIGNGSQLTGIQRTRQFDYSGSYSYQGSAPSGSSVSASVWDIYRIEIFISGTVDTKFASNAIWADRYTTIYT